MRVSSVQRRYLLPRTPTVRPVGTPTVTLRRWDKDLCASDVTIRDGFSRSDAHLRFIPFSAGTRWVPTTPNCRTNGSKVEYLKIQATSESRRQSSSGKECCHFNKRYISRNMSARDLHEQRFAGGESVACTRSARYPLGETLHWVMRALLLLE